MSPYLFVLCIEGLVQGIKASVDNHQWQPFRFSNCRLTLSHLFFSEDLLLFAKASRSRDRVVLHILNQFCQASSQMVSKEKSAVYCSKSVT